MTRISALLASILVLVLAPAAFAAGPVTITHGPEGLTKDASPVFAWDAADATECRLDTGPWLDCADEFRAADLADGGHIFVVRAKDRSANDIRSFTVDTVAPSLTLDATVGGGRGHDGDRRVHRRGRRGHDAARSTPSRPSRAARRSPRPTSRTAPTR